LVLGTRREFVVLTDLQLRQTRPDKHHPRDQPKRHEHCAAARVGGFSVNGGGTKGHSISPDIVITL
jgi:hypothetical protein